MIGNDILMSRKEWLASAAVMAAGCITARRHGQSERRLPVIYDDRGGLFIEAAINGQPSQRLILDTGASRSTLSIEYAKRLGLAVRSGDEITGSAGTVQTQQASAQISIAGLKDAQIDFAIYNFGSYDPQCVGILGYEFLSRAPFQIRYHDRNLVWGAARPRHHFIVTPVQARSRL